MRFVYGVAVGLALSVASGWGALLVVGDAYDLPIPVQGADPGWMTPAGLWVETAVTIEDLDVLVEIRHSEVSDLAIRLTGPAGQAVLLKGVWLPLWHEKRMDMAGTVFDDEAPLALTAGAAPFTGHFRPEGGSLALFDGTGSRGGWTLEVADPIYGDYGRLERWELHVTHVPEPAMVMMAGLGAALVRARKGRR